jgi:hypothetical protein
VEEAQAVRITASRLIPAKSAAEGARERRDVIV